MEDYTPTSSLRWLGKIALCLLAFAPIALLIGHLGSPELSPLVNFVSDYAARATRWRWICATMLCFGLVLLSFAFAFLFLNRGGVRSTLGGMCFTMAGVCMLFVAYYPTARLTDHKVSWEWKDHLKPEQKLTHAERIGWDRAYSDSHYNMIQMALGGIIGGILLSHSAMLSCLRWRKLSKLSLAAAPLMTLLFWLGHSHNYHGLFQRLGFVVVWTWMLFTAAALSGLSRSERLHADDRESPQELNRL